MTARKPPIYLDYHATTPVDQRVADVVMRHMITVFGNASSADHEAGDAAESAVEAARKEVANLIGAEPRAVVFTSGATESVNLALQGFVRSRRSSQKVRLVVSAVEHACVLETCRELVRDGRADLAEIAVDERGRISCDAVEAACAKGADLVCVMAANNEVGNVYPVVKFAAIAARHGAAFLTDATQACGKVPLSVDRTEITFLALSAHKLYGPKGVGALIVCDSRLLHPVSYGGEQERRLRPGTLNVPGIAGLGEACRLRTLEMLEDESAIASRRDRLQQLILSGAEGITVNGDPSARLAGNLHLSVEGVPNTAIIANLRDRLSIATGAACSSRIETPSHVLRAMGLSQARMDGALRFGLGKFTSDDDISEAADLVLRAIRTIRANMKPSDHQRHGRRLSTRVPT